jgi:hypothetical protein
MDITLNLTSNTYSPYTKPANTILYVHKHSNHPPTVTKNLPLNINQRLTRLSANEQEFNKAVPLYQAALKNSGYTHQLTYQAGITEAMKEKRSRGKKITWYNPPYNANVKTNLGRKFLELIEACFNDRHPLRPIFNRHTLKLSYSCMNNIQQYIDAHNKQTLQAHDPEPSPTRTCNCRRSTDCPLNGQCLTTNLVYQATVTRLDNDSIQTYIGLTANDFKTRFRNHKSSFTHSDKRSQTELSKYVWELKDQGVDHQIS